MDVVGGLEMSVTEADGDNQETSETTTSQDNETEVVIKIEPGSSGESVVSPLPAGNVIAIAGSDEKAKNSDKSAQRKRSVQSGSTSKGNKEKSKSLKERCEAEKVHYKIMAWLAVNYRYNPEIINVEKMITLEDIYHKYSDYSNGDPVCDQTCIANCVNIMLDSKKHFFKNRQYLLLEQIGPEKSGEVVTLPPACSSFYDGLDLVLKVKTMDIIDGVSICWYIIWSDKTICVKFRDRVITLIKQAPPKHWVAFSQDNFDRILNLCKKIPFCRGIVAHDDHLEDPKLVVECWANLVDPDKMDCRTRYKYCQIVSIPSSVHFDLNSEAIRSQVICSKCASYIFKDKFEKDFENVVYYYSL